MKPASPCLHTFRDLDAKQVEGPGQRLADQLNKMSAGRALKEIGKLEVALSGEKTPAKAETKASVAEISKAPAPITPIKGGTTAETGSKLDSEGNFHGTYDEWKRLRQAGKIR